MFQAGRVSDKERLPEIEETLDRILQALKVQEETGRRIQSVPLEDACGCVLAETVCAEISVPSFPKSAMDGYAVRAADLENACAEKPVVLSVQGELFAGEYKEFSFKPATAVRVMTGAYVPEGYDAVVRQEDTDYGMEEVSVYTGIKPYMNYCKAGEDIREGENVVLQGTKLTPVHLGLLAGIGRRNVKIYCPLKVAIISTGSELCEVQEPLAPGKIYNNISCIFAAGIRREGLEVVYSCLCPDEEERLAGQLEDALQQADVVITTGGVSVGKRDIVPEALENIGAKVLFRRTNIQPGTPTTASIKDGKLILSLSGNPYAAIVNFEIYFWAVAACLMNCENLKVKQETAVLQSEYEKTNVMRRFIRAKAEGGRVYLPAKVHASSVIHNLTECNCFIDLEPGRRVNVGDEVRIRYIKGM